MSPSCTHRETSASFAASGVKTQAKLNWRSPTVLVVIGVTATLVIAGGVVLTLLLAGGAQAVSDSAAMIGALVALGGVFTAQMVSISLETQRGHEAALQNYFEQVGKLLIEQPLRQSSPEENLSTVVRAQTLTVLEGLEPARKGIVLQFLYESARTVQTEEAGAGS